MQISPDLIVQIRGQALPQAAHLTQPNNMTQQDDDDQGATDQKGKVFEQGEMLLPLSIKPIQAGLHLRTLRLEVMAQRKLLDPVTRIDDATIDVGTIRQKRRSIVRF